ncbi:uncharacterized protein UDID_18585 [Ustilago sp. UG-2017a]|nr:uncharacterized protein UDID_18585 [Ustilago sp. UG-2017a]
MVKASLSLPLFLGFSALISAQSCLYHIAVSKQSCLRFHFMLRREVTPIVSHATAPELNAAWLLAAIESAQFTTFD